MLKIVTLDKLTKPPPVSLTEWFMTYRVVQLLYTENKSRVTSMPILLFGGARRLGCRKMADLRTYLPDYQNPTGAPSLSAAMNRVSPPRPHLWVTKEHSSNVLHRVSRCRPRKQEAARSRRQKLLWPNTKWPPCCDCRLKCSLAVLLTERAGFDGTFLIFFWFQFYLFDFKVTKHAWPSKLKQAIFSCTVVCEW